MTELTQPEIVAMLHEEIDTAPERLINELGMRVLSLEHEEMRLRRIKSAVNPQLSAKVDRLAKLGFTSVQENEVLKKQMKKDADRLADAEVVAKMIKETLRTPEFVHYYQLTYPSSKFLTEAELERICDKYGLIHAPVAAYIGSVPDKNLLEIEKARPLKVRDLPERAIFVGSLGISVNHEHALDHIERTFGRRGYRIEEQAELLDFLKKAQSKSKIKHPGAVRIRSGFTEIFEDEAVFIENEFRVKSPFAREVLGEWRHASEWAPRSEVSFSLEGSGLVRNPQTRSEPYSFAMAPITGFHIAAPAKEFNLEKGRLRKTSKNGYQVEEDPIVFRYCRGGVLVDSKWGLEASDPALINSIDN